MAYLIENALKFGDILLRIARDAAMQKNTAGAVDALPTDPAYLQRCKDAANDARERVYSAIDVQTGNGYVWHCLSQKVALLMPRTADARTISADTSRRSLDQSYQILHRTRWVWRVAANSGYAGRLCWVHPDQFEVHSATGPATSGPPRMACIDNAQHDLDQAGVESPAVLRVWPKPDQDYELVGLCQRLYQPLTEPGDIEPMGPTHRQTIIDVGMFMMKRHDPDLKMRDWYMKHADEAIARSIAHDKRLGPIVLEDVTDGESDLTTIPITVTHYGSVLLS